MTTKSKKILADIYTAIGGVASEQGIEAFDSFYKGGGEKMEKDFISVLKEVGIEVDEPEYTPVEYFDRTAKEKRWGVCTDPKRPEETWVLTGMSSKDECERIIKEVTGK